MIKRLLMNIGGFATYVGSPLIPVALYWDFFVQSDAKTTISTAVLLVLFGGISVISYVFKGDKIPFKVNFFWVILGAIIWALTPIMDKLLVVCMFGAGGSIAGSALFKTAERSLVKDKENKLSDRVTERVRENTNV